MTTSETLKLRRFFGLDTASELCRLYLPTFSGQATLEAGRIPSVQTRLATRGEKTFQYPGHTFADRDAKAASYITSVLSRAVEFESIQWQEAGTFVPGQSCTVFLFGSRSNRAAKWAVETSALGKFFRFEFGRMWSIRCAGDRVFSLPAPAKLSRDEYQQKTDYGVIGRYRDPDAKAHVFLIAGLGSRATEGCGLYLAQHWKDLAQTFRGRNFAVVLKFPPPIDPMNSEKVVAFDDDHAEGFSPAF